MTKVVYYGKNYWYWRRRKYWRKRRFFKSIKAVQKEYHKVNLKMDFLITPNEGGVGDNPEFVFSPLVDPMPTGFPKATMTFRDLLEISKTFEIYKNLYEKMKITGVAVVINVNLGTTAGASNHVVRLYVSEMHASNLTSEAVSNSQNAFILPSATGAKPTRRYFRYMDKDWVDTDNIQEFNGRIAIGCSPDIVPANIEHYERYNLSVVLYCSFKNNIFNKPN